MTHVTNEHPPARGKKLAIALSLAKLGEGVSHIENLRAGGGIRLAAQIWKLEKRGHRFGKEREGVEGYTRYRWLGFDPSGGDHSANTSETSHKRTTQASVPPCPPKGGRRPPYRGEGGNV